MMTEIQLIDYKGDFWHLIYATAQISKDNGRWYAFWHAPERPDELGGYEIIWTEIFTEWWTG